jgi:uncharacterized YccA/Bax inhibitor family protein
MKTSNPALSERAFRNLPSTVGERMTVGGTVNKGFILIALVLASALWSWTQAYPSGWSMAVPPEMPSWYMLPFIGTIGLSFAIIFKPTMAPYLTPVYAILEGLLLGAISAMFEFKYPGIAMQAMLSTIATFIAMLLSYRSGLIQATDKFKRGVMAATGGIFLVYMIDMVMHFFGVNVPFIHSAGPFGIIVSLVIVGVAALNLILDFDFIEKGAQQGAPKYMEWYGAFGLLVTLVWLYLEILRLLSKGRDR